MTAKGHQLLALTAGLPLIKYSYDFGFIDNYGIMAALGGLWIGSVFPDIDEPGSYIGRKFAFLALPISLFIKHRGFTHSLLFALLFIVLGYFTYTPDLSGLVGVFFISFGIGCLLHDAGDMLTKGGIKGFFYPCCNDTVIALLPKQLRFYTNSFIEYLFIFVLFCILIFELSFQFKGFLNVWLQNIA